MPSPEDHEAALVEQVLSKPVNERESFLQAVCGADHLLRQRLGALLAAMDQPATVLATQSDADPSTISRRTLVYDDPVGQTLGRYKLLERIGEGGCGVVYVAEQTHPVRRRVALKVIKLGMDTQQVVARFEAERQALAMMDHPNIAKVLDAGTTETGRPYFVMELVRGVKITDFCDEANSTTQERLDLFIKVCQAIQHAHQKGIIHRDIKPSNVLVTLHDGAPVPKVIDFGIAKATQGKLTDATVYTQLHQFIGTPAYMSPEQAEMSGLDIDTRSDIYSLGVLLYELLAGSPPFDPKELMAAGIDAIRRTIREKEPPRPSTRLATLGANELTTTAKRRSSDTSRLLHQLKGDLDWIVMKCLEKDRQRRYDTAIGLAADLKRHLDNEPVLARPPSAVYKFQKAFRRNKAVFFGIATIATVLVLATVFSSWQAARATRAQKLEATANDRLRIQIDETEKARLAAEKATLAEARQREQSEMAVQTLQIQKAEDLLQRDQSSLAASYLGQVLRFNPSNVTAATRLISVLTRPFCQAPLEPLRHELGLVSAEFSPDGLRVVTASKDKTAQVWDARTGQPMGEPLRHVAPLSSARFSPDGLRVVTASEDSTAQVWNVRTSQPLNEPLQHNGRVQFAEFSADGLQIVTASLDETARVWDARTGRPIGEPLRHGAGVLSAKFSPDGRRILTASGDSTARIWDAQTGRPVTEPLRHGDEVNWAEFSPGGMRVVTVSSDRTARIWDARTGQPLTEPLRHSEKVYTVRFSPDGRWVLTTAESNAAQLWDSRTGLPWGDPLRHEAWVISAEFSPDGQRVVTTSWDGAARIWDTRACQPLTEALRHGQTVTSAQFSPNGQRVITTSWDGTARIWEAHSGQPMGEPLAREIRGTPFGVSPDGQRIATIDPDRRVRVRNWRTGKLLAETPPHPDYIQSAQFNADGRQIITLSGDHTVHVWDAQSGQPLSQPLYQKNKALCVYSHPMDLHVVLLEDDKTVRVCEAHTGKPTGQPLRHLKNVSGAEFSPDGRRVATRTLNSARVWDARTGQALTPELRHEHVVKFVRFSPDGRLVLTGSHDRTARVWESETGLPLGEPLRHERWLNDAAFSPDSLRVVTGSEDKTARVWDARTGQPLSEPFRHEGRVSGVRFTPEGLRVFTTSGGGTLLSWETLPPPVPVPGWFLDWAEARVNHRFVSGPNTDSIPLSEQRRRMEQVASRADTNFYTQIAQWAQANPATRPISPFATVTAPEYVQLRIDDNTLTSLLEAVRIAPTHERAGFRLAVHELLQTSFVNPQLLMTDESSPKDIWRLYPTNLLLTAFAEELQKSVATEPWEIARAQHLATVHLWLGETNAHKALCRNLLDQIAPSQEPAAISRIAHAYLLCPNPELKWLKEAANASRLALKMANADDSHRPQLLVTDALAALREGKPSHAESQLNEALKTSAAPPELRALALGYRSFARARLGRVHDARADLSELEKLLPIFPARPSLSRIILQPEWMAVSLARDEVKNLINSASTSTHP